MMPPSYNTPPFDDLKLISPLGELINITPSILKRLNLISQFRTVLYTWGLWDCFGGTSSLFTSHKTAAPHDAIVTLSLFNLLSNSEMANSLAFHTILLLVLYSIHIDQHMYMYVQAHLSYYIQVFKCLVRYI